MVMNSGAGTIVLNHDLGTLLNVVWRAQKQRFVGGQRWALKGDNRVQRSSQRREAHSQRFQCIYSLINQYRHPMLLVEGLPCVEFERSFEAVTFHGFGGAGDSNRSLPGV
jgi:hypothetical protein